MTLAQTECMAGAGGETPPAPAMRLNNVHVGWDASLVLHGITVDIPCGQTVAITGANGSGKSSLLRACLGTAPITEGSVELFGTNIADSHHVPWDRIGYVPQRFTAGGGIASTVAEVVASGLLGPRRLFRRRGDKQAVFDALDRVGLRHRASDSMAILSGGQQQRVLIARALIRNPDLLLMDEPMAGIDAHSRGRLAQIIDETRQRGTTIVLVLHELGELANLLDRELHIQAGHIGYDGPVDDHDLHLHPHEDPHHHPDTTRSGHRTRRHRYSAATIADVIPGGDHA